MKIIQAILLLHPDTSSDEIAGIKYKYGSRRRASKDYDNLMADIGSEAIKEFAERLKESMRLEDDCEYVCGQCCYGCKEYIPIIDNLVKEMTKN